MGGGAAVAVRTVSIHAVHAKGYPPPCTVGRVRAFFRNGRTQRSVERKEPGR